MDGEQGGVEEDAKLLWRSAGHQVISRSDDVDKVRTGAAEVDALEEELRQFIPSPGSSAESSQLRLLRQIQGKLGKQSSDVSDSFRRGNSSGHTQPDRRRRHETHTKTANGRMVETELYWSGKRLVWSRDAVPIRAFSYEENIKCACWAWMDTESSDTDDMQASSQKESTSSSAEDDLSARRALRRAKSTFRALCIFLTSCMVIYHPHTGQEYIKRLDLSVKSVYPLDIGIFIQRETEMEDRKKAELLLSSEEPTDRPLATLFYLRRPFDELKAVEVVDTIRYPGAMTRDSATLSRNTDVRSFDEVDESVLMVSIEPPILVSRSTQNRSLRVYTYAHKQSPFKRHEPGPNKIKSVNPDPITTNEQQNIRMSSATLMRRSTTDVPRPRPSTRQKPPPRKSARLESGSTRASISGQRSSMASKRPRTTSNPGHTRRVSAGLTSVFGHSGFLHDEQEHADTDEENIQDVMQLLDEFDEVQGGTPLLQDVQSGPSVLAPLTQGHNVAHRRRASRATIIPSAQQGGATTVANLPSRSAAVPKARPINGRRISRSRMSMALGNSTDSNPVSVAMELTQKDEASKMALSASTDKAMSRGISIEGVNAESDSQAQGLPLFSTFSQGFAAVSLIEEIPLGKSSEDVHKINAFVKRTDGMVLLHMLLASSNRLITRQIYKVSSKDAVSYIIRVQLPPADMADPEVKCCSALSVRSENGQDLLVLQAEQKTSFHLVLGAPGPLAISADLDFQQADMKRAEKMPFQLTTRGLSRLAIKIEPMCPLTTRILSMCECVLESRLFRQMQMAWIKCQPIQGKQEWDTMKDLLLFGHARTPQASDAINPRPMFDSLLRLTNHNLTSKKDSISHQSTWTKEDMAKIVAMLNWAAQEARADLCERGKDLQRLGDVILSIAHQLGWTKWCDFWHRLLPSSEHVQLISEDPTLIEEAPLVDLYDLVYKAKNGYNKSIPDTIKQYLPKMVMLINVFSAPLDSKRMVFDKCMSGSPISIDFHASFKIVNAMLAADFTLHQVKRLPFSLALPLYEAINSCRLDPPLGWSRQAYSFIGREDLAMQLAPRTSEDEASIASTLTSTLHNRLFPQDYRLREVSEMLQSSRAVAVRGPEVASVEDQDSIAEKQRRVFVSASDRIKSLSVGRGMYNLSSVAFKSTDQWKISPISLRIRMLNNCIIQNREPDLESAEMEWPEFHNGVASALQLSVGSNDKLESTWLFSQLNKEFNSRHAGFILGIGLQGQLKNLGKIHAHQYLSARHSPTTIGLLLGISLSFMSSSDPLAKALMSIHLIHTLPTHSRPLKTSMLEQSAALVGLGFVFLQTKDRWASRMAFKAIAAETVFTDDSQMLKRECFSLSAGISLGLTCLGGGRKPFSLAGEIEKEIVPGLERLIQVFVKENAGGEEDQRKERMVDEKQYSAFEWAPNISLTTTPASIALALIYLKSNRSDKADKMPLPHNTDDLDSIRPDMLTIRAICRSLIQWDAIEASSQWLIRVLPDFLQFQDVKLIKKASENSQLAFWSLRLGSIFAIGLKYAGSSDVTARACLMEQLYLYQSQIDLRPANYFEKIRQQLLQSSVDVILTALSMVMAGRGDVEVLQHLRKALYRIDNLRFGNYMANSMAIGLLFLGAGRFTLASSDIAIAALLISFYPRYPINAQDNRCHLQAYRHFWMLAVEARLLSVEDVDSGESTRMPVILERKAGGDLLTLSTPCLLPQLNQIKSIRIASERYYPSVLHLEGDHQLKGQLNLARKLYVKKRAADMNHEEDRWGKSSIRARREGMSDFLPLPMCDKSGVEDGVYRKHTCEELRKLIEDNVHDQEIRTSLDTILHRHGSTSARAAEEDAFENFALHSILECLLEDKLDILPIMIGMYSATQAFLTATWSQSHLFHLQDLRFTLESMRSSSQGVRHLLKEEYVASLWHSMQDKMISELTQGDDSSLRQAFVKYARNVDRNVDDKGSYGWDGGVEERQKLAALLFVAEVPSLPILKEIKSLCNEQRKSQDIAVETTPALVKSVLLQLGHNTRDEVLKMILEAWEMYVK